MFDDKDPKSILYAEALLGLLKLKSLKNGDKERPKYTKKSYLQKRVLERVFKIVQTPNNALKENHALLLNLNPRIIQIYFQNSRAFLKRSKKEVENKTFYINPAILLQIYLEERNSND
ncbi:HD4 [Hepatospora eriocheir]|uniref:HD4 n=1 Tax=Hepatospora eriocheir TaxID=1081669 RepID=A0A1X0QDU1_9MICR|nr:HD4 [Hepatospora eriocheir]